MKQAVTELFAKHFGRTPAAVVRAPGRVNLIGEHTDYNDGFVLPMAIERATWIAFAPTGDSQVRLVTANYNEEKSFDLRDLEFRKEGWIEYVKGVAWALGKAGFETSGWEGVLTCDIPIGSGLSSSAALEMAIGRVFGALGNYEPPAGQLARIGQTAENEWVGMKCGIMDQLASAGGRDGAALLIDCRSLDVREVPLPSDCRIVIMDTGTRRKLVDSAYNERRAQCEAGAAFFGKKALRDVSIDEFRKREKELDPITAKRCRHVITENDRTCYAADVLQSGDAKRFGELMNDSHESLRVDFEVSSAALDVMSEIARRYPACLGARMTGAGFGGCAVALVYADGASDFIRRVSKEYQESTGNTPQLFDTAATDGAKVV